MYATQDAHAPVGVNPGSAAPASVTGSQDYGQAYAGYPASGDAYQYDNTSYQGYSYSYPQQGNPSHSQHVGAYENSAPPYQPANSFHNINSYGDSGTYQGASTYYSAPPGGYQNTATYPQSGYASHWGGGSYGNYGAYPGYSGYGQMEASGAVNSGQAQGNHYTADYHQQWADYYASFPNGPPVDADDCPAPGTETMTSAPMTESVMYSQPPPPGTQPQWDLNEKPYSEPATLQAGLTTPSDNGGVFLSNFHQDQYSHIHTSAFQPSTTFLHQNVQEQVPQYQPPPPQEHHTLMQQGQPVQTPASYKSGSSFQPKALQSPPLPEAPLRRGKLQMLGNARVTLTLAAATVKPINLESVHAQNPFSKPAYVSVTDKPSALKSSSDAVADAMLQPGMFPPSLRAYVERALSRCKDDLQKKACQEIMKEMITSASANGSLFTKNWDTEPLFPLPSLPSTSGKGSLEGFPKQERSPTRRAKSRWEPITEVKPDEKLNMQIEATNKAVMWNFSRGEVPVTLKWEKQNGIWNKSKLLLQQQFFDTKEPKRAAKKARKDVPGEVQEVNSSEGSEDEAVCGGGVYLGTVGSAETPDEKLRRQSRTKRFDKNKDGNGGGREGMRNKGSIGASARRATALILAKSYGDGLGGAVEDIDWDSLTVKGTCQEIEKRYLRLTSAPDPNTVRPEEVLKKALTMVQTTNKNYLFKCEQLKSIRQDLTVQRIQNELTVQVYETHARMALEGGDLPEYNQCQSQLKGLYAEGLKGCNNEFTAYSLLYIIFQHGNNRDLLSSMARLSQEAKEDEAVKHALAVRAAVAAGNYIAFFQLYRTAPNLGTCLMDLYVEKMRFEALRCMARAYRPTLAMSFIGRTLGFLGLGASESSSEVDLMEGLDECEEWLRAHGAVLIHENGSGEWYMDCKASATCLFMPEPEDAVAHGDANLAVNDFLAQG